jgi:hypothetical protein
MAILNTNTSESWARIVTFEGQAQDAGFKITRQWPWIQGHGAASNDTHVNSLWNTMKGVTSVTNPKVNNDSYAGKFIASSCLVRDENADGTGNRATSIVQVLTKVKTTLSTEASLGTPDIGSDKEILHYLDIEPGTDEHCYYIYKNLDPAARSTAQSVSISVPSGYTAELKRKFDVEPDKTGTLYVVFIKRTWNAWAHDSYKVDFTEYDDYGNYEQRTSRMWQRIIAANQTQAVKDLKSESSPIAVTSGHKIDSIRVGENNDGSVSILRTEQKIVYTHDEYSWTTRYGREWYAWGHCNYVAAVAAIGGLTDSTANSIHKTYDKYNLYHWTISKSPFGEAGGGIGERNGSAVIVRPEFAQIWNSTLNRSVRARRYIKTVATIKFYPTYGQAHQGITDGNAGSHAAIKNGLGVAYKTLVTRGSNNQSYNDNIWTSDENLAP